MRRRAVKLVAMAMLLMCIESHVSELLDTWDDTFETGNDIESALIIFGLTVGAALSLASAAVVLVSKTKSFNSVRVAHALPRVVSELIISTHSPQLTLARVFRFSNYGIIARTTCHSM